MHRVVDKIASSTDLGPQDRGALAHLLGSVSHVPREQFLSWCGKFHAKRVTSLARKFKVPYLSGGVSTRVVYLKDVITRFIEILSELENDTRDSSGHLPPSGDNGKSPDTDYLNLKRREQWRMEVINRERMEKRIVNVEMLENTLKRMGQMLTELVEDLERKVSPAAADMVRDVYSDWTAELDDAIGRIRSTE